MACLHRQIILSDIELKKLEGQWECSGQEVKSSAPFVDSVCMTSITLADEINQRLFLTRPGVTMIMIYDVPSHLDDRTDKCMTSLADIG